MQGESAVRFDERPNVVGDANWLWSHPDHAARYLYAAQFVRDRRVLDAGTGPGYGAAILREAGAVNVQAVDRDEPTIEGAMCRYAMSGLEFKVDDCETLSEVEGPIDVICSFENIEHLAQPKRFLRAAVDLLGPTGILLISSPDRGGACPAWVDGKPANLYHVTEWYRDEFGSLLSEYFQKVELRAQAISHAAVARQQAVKNLQAHLNYLWATPLVRLARGLGKMIGRRYEWPDIQGLAVSSHGDYPIVSYSAVDSIGQSFCHYAICSGARK